MFKDVFANAYPTDVERLRLLEAAHHIVRENGTYEEALSMIDGIDSNHLTVFITAQAFPHRDTVNGVLYIRPIVEAVLGDADNVRDHLDELDETKFRSLLEYLQRLEELSGAGHLEEAFFRLCSGLDVTACSSHVSKETGLPVDDIIEEIPIDGHTAQLKAALAVQLSLYREFEEFLDFQIQFLKEQLASK